MSEKRGFTPAQAAEYFGVSVDTVRRLIRASLLPAHYLGKIVLVDKADLDAYFDSLPSERIS